MFKRWPVASIFGIMAVAVYSVLSFVSYLHFPAAYSPLHNALSQMGAPSLNPSGAVYYDLGGILMSALLVPFYLGMRRWNTGDRLLRILITGAQVAGIISSLGLAWSCVFTAGPDITLHVMGAGTAFISSVFFWIFMAFTLLRIPESIKWMAYFGYLPLASNTVLAVIPAGRFLIEWVAVGFFLVYVVMLCFNGRVILLRRTEGES